MQTETDYEQLVGAAREDSQTGERLTLSLAERTSPMAER